ncbi:minor capsid protein, partial [Acinetobacter baumannii]
MASKEDKSLIEILTQHQAYLYRLSSQSVNELLKIFNDESALMLARLRDLLDELNDSEKVALASGQYTTSNLKEIRDLIAQWFTAINTALPEAFAISATALAVYEANYTAKLYGGKIKKPNGEKLYAAAKKIPLVGGALVDDLLSRIAENARQKVEYAIRDGINSGKTNQEIVQRIRGTKRLNYEDGLLSGTKTDIDRTVRTVRSHVANQAYLNSFNQIGFEYVKLVATLDGRTSKLCASLDGAVWEINDPAKRVPPLHPNCRSIVNIDQINYLTPPPYGIWLPPYTKHSGINRNEVTHATLYVHESLCQKLPQKAGILLTSSLVPALLDHLRQNPHDETQVEYIRLLQVLLD